MKSDGTPWRPLVHIEDISPRLPRRARGAASSSSTTRRSTSGAPTENYRIRDVAEIVGRRRARTVASRFADGAGPDLRNYRVNCDKLVARPAGFAVRKWTVRRGVEELLDAFQAQRARRSRISRAPASCASRTVLRAASSRSDRQQLAMGSDGRIGQWRAGLRNVSSDRPCRSCGSRNLRSFLDLGTTPARRRPGAPRLRLEIATSRFPLDVAFCPDCSLVQILEEVPAEKLFVDNYLYFSSFSDAPAQPLARPRAAGSSRLARLGPDEPRRRAGEQRRLPAEELRRARHPGARHRPGARSGGGRRTRPACPRSPSSSASTSPQQLVAEGKRADVIIANNVMAHVPDLNGFVAGMRVLLADDGVDHDREPVRARSDRPLRVRHHLPRALLLLLVHRGRHARAPPRPPPQPRRVLPEPPRRHAALAHRHAATSARRWRSSSSVTKKNWASLTSTTTSASHAASRDVRDRCARCSQSLRDDGSRIAGYGAAAKGATLLNYVGIGTDLVDFVVDRNVHKQGLLMPGTHQPIRDPSRRCSTRCPTTCCCSPGTSKDEIMRAAGGVPRRAAAASSCPCPIPPSLPDR